MKNCSRCKELKPLEMFYKEAKTKDGKRPDCKKCVDKLNKSRCPLKEKDHQLKKLYGITLDQYNQMFTNQNGNCAICKRNQSEFEKKLHVDHCHATGKVRGLLCSTCNQAIGLLKEDQVIILAAAKYLQVR